jgi:hypothetical protein
MYFVCKVICNRVLLLLCNQCLSSLKLWVRIPLRCTCRVYSIQHYVIKFVSDLWQVGGFLRLLQYWQTLSHNVVSNTPYMYIWGGFELTTLVMIGTDCTGSCKSWPLLPPKVHVITMLIIKRNNTSTLLWKPSFNSDDQQFLEHQQIIHTNVHVHFWIASIKQN